MLLIFTGLTALPAFSQASDITRGKAAELTLHRIERLVILRKIDASFQSKLSRLTVDLIAHRSNDQPAFKSTTYELPPANGAQKTLELVMDSRGKEVTHNVGGDAEADNAPSWGDSDAVTLAESALHCIQGEDAGSSKACASNPDLAQFNAGFSSLILSQDGSGPAPVAAVEIHGANPGKILKIRLKLDGTLADHPFEIAPAGTAR